MELVAEDVGEVRLKQWLVKTAPWKSVMESIAIPLKS